MTEEAKKRKVTHNSGRRSDRGSKKRERSRIIPEGQATEEAKKRKVTHNSERLSDGGAIKEKGHAYFRKSKRQRRQKRERSRIFPEGQATEGAKKRKVTHVPERAAARRLTRVLPEENNASHCRAKRHEFSGGSGSASDRHGSKKRNACSMRGLVVY